MTSTSHRSDAVALFDLDAAPEEFEAGRSDLLGSWEVERMQCGDEHLLACFNPWAAQTFCQCGQVRIPGGHSSWHERTVYDHAGPGAQLLGYDRYVLEFCDCHPDALVTWAQAHPEPWVEVAA